MFWCHTWQSSGITQVTSGSDQGNTGGVDIKSGLAVYKASTFLRLSSNFCPMIYSCYLGTIIFYTCLPSDMNWLKHLNKYIIPLVIISVVFLLQSPGKLSTPMSSLLATTTFCSIGHLIAKLECSGFLLTWLVSQIQSAFSSGKNRHAIKVESRQEDADVCLKLGAL